MEEKNFSPEQSLQLIQSMIQKTKEQITDNSKYFLLWGWLTVVAILGQFVLKVLVKYQGHYYVWFILFAGIAVSVYWGVQDEKKEKVKTYVSESMKHLWSGMGISFFVMTVLFSKLGFQYCYPFFILMYGLGTFVTGRLLNYKPFIIGGIVAWVLSAVSIQFKFDYQMLFAVGALLASYIIPAHMFRFNNKTQKA
jgi:hypothetical protein